MGTPRLTGLNQPGEPIGTRAMPTGLTIGFLAAQGVPPTVLADAEREAGRTGVSPDLALLSRGLVSERSFYASSSRCALPAASRRSWRATSALPSSTGRSGAGLTVQRPSGPDWWGCRPADQRVSRWRPADCRWRG